MNGLAFSPALGWIAGPLLAAAMLLAGVAYALWFASHRAQSDATVVGCVRRVLIAATLAAMVMTPAVPVRTVSRAISATDIFIAVDVTGSMAVSDAAYGDSGTISRLDAARDAVADIVKAYPDASFAGISFGASASLDVPLTPDAMAMTNWATGLAAESTSASSGSSLDAPLDRLLLSMKAARDQHPDDAILLYLISDGEQTSNGTRRTFSSLRAYVSDATVIGVGSEQGGTIPLIADGATAGASSGDAAQDWVIDPSTGQPGISKLDEANLRAIADEVSGSYLHADDAHTVAAASDKASSAYRLTTSAKERTRMEPVVWPLTIVLLALLAGEAASWIITSRRLL